MVETPQPRRLGYVGVSTYGQRRSLDARPDQLRADGRMWLYRETARGKLAEAGGR
jgi:hypothetical protein